MTTQQKRRFDRARRAFERACEGATVAEIDAEIARIVSDVREERAAKQREIDRDTTSSSATFDVSDWIIHYAKSPQR